MNELYKSRANVCKTCTCGDILNAERVLVWVVHSSFQIHWFINHFFGSGIIVQNNRMIQVPSCEHALIKTNRIPIQNYQSKSMLRFKTYTLEVEFDRHLEHMFAIRECKWGSRVSC